jgi:YidC/Oxa1 family membrane protein insertase
MQHIYDIVGNWGWSIVLVTVVIKIIFYQLSAKSYRSMAAMKQLQPRIKTLQERFSGNKQELSKAMMELYKKEKVNPLGGCFPLLIQIPVFIALYWVIVESVELRQAPFIFWIHDLAMKDPFYVLPIIMGLTMFIQQKISPPPPDPVQAKVMMLLPVVFTVFFLQFPAGLVLYWIVNNTLSISQQWYMMRKYSGEKIDNKAQKKLDKKR